MPPGGAAGRPRYRFAALAWLGRLGARAVAALVFIGIAVPPLGALLRPFVGEAVFLLLCVSFARVDAAKLHAHFRRPGLILAGTAWTALAAPLLIGLAARAAHLDRAMPDLFLGLMLQAVASPLMATPALAALMGLDATLVLITLVAGTALVPLTAPLLARLFLGEALAIPPLQLGLRLSAILLGALLVALAVRRLAGAEAIRRHDDAVSGFNILLLLVFVTAVMGDLASELLADPVEVAGIALLALGIFLALFLCTAAVFWRTGRERALSLGLATSQRNMGLMLAATDGVLPGTAWLYFALCQFPIYLAPQLLRPLMARLIGRRS